MTDYDPGKTCELQAQILQTVSVGLVCVPREALGFQTAGAR